jgi:hypothetical protein
MADERDKIMALRLRAHRARTNLVDFFEFVMREEQTRARMTAAAHQRVLFSFIQHHPKCVVILPVDHTKTFSLLTYALFQLAEDTGRRGLVLSKTQRQATKITNLMRQIVEEEPRIKLVNPMMVPSRRRGDPWSDTKFTVQRELGPKDPSFAAAGLDTAIGGYRLDFCIADDILDYENTRTPERRRETLRSLDMMVKSRMTEGSRLVFTNSTFHSGDALNVLRKPPPHGPGYPALVMSALGDVWVHNEDPAWDTPGLRQASGNPTHFRLMAHEPDPEHRRTLWPARWPPKRLEDKRAEYVHDPGSFNRLYMSNTKDDSTAHCKQEFVDLCLARARAVGAYGQSGDSTKDFAPYYGMQPGTTLQRRPGDDFMTITGVDLAFKSGSESDYTALFTFECNRPDGLYRILDIEFGHWDTMTIAEKAIGKARRFNSLLGVEDNGGASYMISIIETKLGIPARDPNGQSTKVMEMSNYVQVEALTTTETAKAHPEYGVETLFYEMARGLWLIPNRDGLVRHEVQKFVDECTEYTPTAHPGDVLMAAFIARRLASKYGALARPVPGQGSGLGSIMVR